MIGKNVLGMLSRGRTNDREDEVEETPPLEKEPASGERLVIEVKDDPVLPQFGMKSVIKTVSPYDSKNYLGNIDLNDKPTVEFDDIFGSAFSLERLVEKTRLSCQYVLAISSLMRTRSRFLQLLVDALVNAFGTFAKASAQRAERYGEIGLEKVKSLIKLASFEESSTGQNNIENLVKLKVELSMAIGDFSPVAQDILNYLAGMRKKISEDERFAKYADSVGQLQQAFCSVFSRVLRNINDSIRDYSELGEEQRNLWFIEFNIYTQIRDFLKFYTKEYVIKFVSFTNKLEAAEHKIQKIMAQVDTYFSESESRLEPLPENLQEKLSYDELISTQDVLSLLPPKFLSIFNKTIDHSCYSPGKKPTTTREKINKFFNSYRINLKVRNNLIEFFMDCHVIQLGQIMSCILLIDVQFA